MVSSLSVLWNKVLLVSRLIVWLHVVRLYWIRLRPIKRGRVSTYFIHLLFKTSYSSLHHGCVVVAFISTSRIVRHLVMRVMLRTVKRFLISSSGVLRLRLLLLSHHEVLNSVRRMSFYHVWVLWIVFSVRFTLCLRYTGSLRAGSLLLRLLSISSILRTNSLSSNSSSSAILRRSNFILVTHLFHKGVVVLL